MNDENLTKYKIQKWLNQIHNFSVKFEGDFFYYLFLFYQFSSVSVIWSTLLYKKKTIKFFHNSKIFHIMSCRFLFIQTFQFCWTPSSCNSHSSHLILHRRKRAHTYTYRLSATLAMFFISGYFRYNGPIVTCWYFRWSLKWTSIYQSKNISIYRFYGSFYNGVDDAPTEFLWYFMILSS